MSKQAKSLTYEQRRIVDHAGGHALVKAVPGSGKTTTLVKRVQRLLSRGLDPRKLLVLMYNKSAQVSFTEKLKKAIKRTDNVPEVRTFHSLAFKIVRYAEGQQFLPYKKLLTPTDKRYQDIIKAAYCHGYDHTVAYIDPNEIEEFELFIARCRSAAVTPSDVAADPTFSRAPSQQISAYRHFCELLEEQRLRTFDDLLIDAASLLRQHPELGGHFSHIIIDEYQDVNFIQHDLIRLVSKSQAEVMAVGDVNQCIYEWRGSRPDFIAGIFERHFSGTTVYQLSCTFRFGHELSLMANSLISRNATKITKLCVSHPTTPKTEASIHFGQCLSRVISRLANSDNSTAVLARSNAHLAEAEVALRLSGVPYCYLNSNTTLFDRNEVGLLVAAFMLCVDGGLSRLDNHRQKNAILYGFLRELGIRWQKGQMTQAFNALMRSDTEVWQVLRDAFAKSSHHQHLRLDDLIALQSTTTGETSASDVFKRLANVGLINSVGDDSVSRQESNDQRRGIVRIEELLASNRITAHEFLDLMLNPREPACDLHPVTLATMHGAKGLEWDNVIIVGLNESDFPGGPEPDDYTALRAQQALQNNEGLEEERRLFYVGITRAKNQLHLVVPIDEGLSKWLNSRWTSTPKKKPAASRFVYELGMTASQAVSEEIYNNTAIKNLETFSKFFQWYIRDLKRLRV